LPSEDKKTILAAIFIFSQTSSNDPQKALAAANATEELTDAIFDAEKESAGGNVGQAVKAVR